jgi:hypothetical protein
MGFLCFTMHITLSACLFDILYPFFPGYIGWIPHIGTIYHIGTRRLGT